MISAGLTASHPATTAAAVVIAGIGASHLSRVSTGLTVCLKSARNRIRRGVWWDEASGVECRHPGLADLLGGLLHATPTPAVGPPGDVFQ